MIINGSNKLVVLKLFSADNFTNEFFNDYEVEHIDGDKHDFRFNHGKAIVWLSEKK